MAQPAQGAFRLRAAHARNAGGAPVRGSLPRRQLDRVARGAGRPARGRDVVIGGVVLAAGEGSRFGGAKQLADLNGRPLLEHSLAALAAVPAVEKFVLVLGARAEEIRSRIDSHGAVGG